VDELGGEAADLLATTPKSAAYLQVSFVPAFDVAQRKQTGKRIKSVAEKCLFFVRGLRALQFREKSGASRFQ
jgi:hypothetical protein